MTTETPDHALRGRQARPLGEPADPTEPRPTHPAAPGTGSTGEGDAQAPGGLADRFARSAGVPVRSRGRERARRWLASPVQRLVAPAVPVRVEVLLVVVGLLLGGAAAEVVAQRSPTYAATVQVFVTTATVDSSSGLWQADQFTQSRVQSYVAFVTSPDVLEPVARELGLDDTRAQLAARVSARAPLNTSLVDLTATAGTAEEAADLANAVAGQFTELVSSVEASSSGAAKGTPLKISVVQPATPPTSPDGPPAAQLLLVGLLGGGLAGAALAYARLRLRPRAFSLEQAATATGTPGLGVVSWDPRAGRARDALRDDRDGRRAEELRAIRVQLQPHRTSGEGRSVVVAGVAGGEGASSVALGAARAFAESGQATLLVDLASPDGRAGLSEHFGLADRPGLLDVVLHREPLASVLVELGPGLWVLPHGLPGDHRAVLASGRLLKVLDTLRERFPWTVVDGGSLSRAAQVAEVMAGVDDAVLVARSGSTTLRSLARASASVTGAGAQLRGVVLNRDV